MASSWSTWQVPPSPLCRGHPTVSHGRCHSADGALGGVFGCMVPLGTVLSLGLTLIHPKDGSSRASNGDTQVLLSPCPSQNPPSSSGGFTVRPLLTLQPGCTPCPALRASRPQTNADPPHPQLLVLASCESSLTGPPWRWWRCFYSCPPQWHLSPWTCSSVGSQSPGRCLPPRMWLFQHGMHPTSPSSSSGNPKTGI